MDRIEALVNWAQGRSEQELRSLQASIKSICESDDKLADWLEDLEDVITEAVYSLG